MKRIISLICCFALLSICGLAQKNARPAMSDEQFVDFAGQTDMVDANLGKLASSVAPYASVKDYAQKLVTDQTGDFQELSKAAHESSLHVPNAIDEERDKTIIGPFQKLTGAAFDHRFDTEMVAGHTTAIGIYKNEAAHAHTAALRSYATEALPILQADLAEAKKMEVTKAATKKG